MGEVQKGEEREVGESSTESPASLAMVRGINRLRTRAASQPFITGMEKSSTIRLVTHNFSIELKIRPNS
jgi:hypothetical protein